MPADILKRSMHILLAMNVRKGHITFYCSDKAKHSLFKKIWVSKGFHVLTNTQGPIKIWVPKSST